MKSNHNETVWDNNKFIKTRLINDVLFKYVFASTADSKLLVYLLNAILELKKGERIKKLTILNPFNKDNILIKETILDVKAEDERWRLYDIEVQLLKQLHYVDRMIYYVSSLYSKQLEVGTPFNNLKKCISLSILDHTLLKEEILGNWYFKIHKY